MRSEGATNHSAVVVGGGPAGLMAAEILATAGVDVLLVEHQRSVGRKLLLAGRSGLNLTNSEPIDSFLERYSTARPNLEDAIRSFDPTRLRAWAESLGEDTYIGSSGRVFPDSWRATPLLRAWISRLKDLGVRFVTGHRFVGWAAGPNAVVDPTRLLLAEPNGSIVEQAADVTVLALGGASWPNVGSDGRWVSVLRSAGIDVSDLEPSNAGVEVAWSDTFRERFEGVPLKNVAISHAGMRVRGDVMVTKRGLEGTPVYVHTAAVRAALEASGTATLMIDLHPDLTLDQVVERLQRRRPRDSWSNWLRRSLGLSPLAIALLREATDNQPPRDPDEVAHLVSALPLTVNGTTGINRAISSAGGVRLAELDASFMLRKLPGVFVAGEMLDWEAPTGGYLLQATFSSAVAAAQGAVRWVTMNE